MVDVIKEPPVSDTWVPWTVKYSYPWEDWMDGEWRVMTLDECEHPRLAGFRRLAYQKGPKFGKRAEIRLPAPYDVIYFRYVDYDLPPWIETSDE